AEESKVAVRSIRRDAIEHIKKIQKNGEITEDERKKAEDEMQKITDNAIKEVDAIAGAKEKEIMSV
nr:ribosome-recycling factor [Clostridia bacterium]